MGVPEPNVDRQESITQREWGSQAGQPGPARPHGRYTERVTIDRATERAANLRRARSLVGLVVGLIVGLILIRVLLRLIAANPTNPFASIIYGLTTPFVALFNGLTPHLSAGDVVFELSSVIAVMVYLLIGWLILRLLSVLLDRPVTRSATTQLEEQE